MSSNSPSNPRFFASSFSARVCSWGSEKHMPMALCCEAALISLQFSIYFEISRRFERDARFGSGDFDAAADGSARDGFAVALGEDGWELAAVGEREPEPQEVALAALARGEVCVLRAGMENLVVVDELHIAWDEFHVESDLRVRRKGVHEIQRLHLFWRESWELGKAGLGGVDEAPVVHGIELPRMAAKHGHLKPRLLSLRYLALAIVEEGLFEHLDEVGSALQDFVVHRRRGGDVGEPTLLRGREARESNNVARVGVIRLRFRGLIDARLGFGRVTADVFDVAQEVPASILSHRIAEQVPEKIERGACVLDTAVHLKAAHEHEPTRGTLLANHLRHLCEFRPQQLPRLLWRDAGEVIASADGDGCSRERIRFTRRERTSPLLRGHVPTIPSTGSLHRRWRR
mmetsp:Transcript_12833/g.42355  ORF Transcript_12833/g.42355 Transcript_12833/m.42355 type:complete len:402 (-) Transcript_12833:173-1378(-)